MHEKYREFGGPDGGDGGRGGDVIFKVDDNLNTLYYFKTHHKLKAENGERGKRRKCHGRDGKNLTLSVPRGTVIIDEKSGHALADLSEKDEFVVAKGGDGGFGNAHFSSSVRQTPKVGELGEPGEEFELTLELKMIADVGFIGLPNVGKSTLLSVVSAARPKIADYEFTTLVPNLGVVEEGTFGVERGFIAADIPGLIEGASKGKGLGDEFLRHIERTKVLVHILDATHDDLVSDYKTIRQELKDYQIDLTDKLEVVALSKIDTLDPKSFTEKLGGAKKAAGSKKVFAISAVAHKGLSELLHEVEKVLKAGLRSQVTGLRKEEEYKVFTIEDVVGQDLFSVEKTKEGYEVKGNKIEKFAIRTDFSNPHAVIRLRDIMKKMGIDKELRRAGVKEGDKIIIAGKEFEF